MWLTSLVERVRVARMARPLRIEYPGAVYHVMARGNQGRKRVSPRIVTVTCHSVLASSFNSRSRSGLSFRPGFRFIRLIAWVTRV